MVCKEDVLLWFKDLESYNRIDLMYEMLNMCVPFELRFLGSCVEEMGKHSYHELRGPAIIANDIEKLARDTTFTHGLMDESVRHRALIYLSLLSSQNCKCANWFYKTLLKTEWLESYIIKRSCNDENIQCELLLLFTMALYHPAFSFDQKTFFGDMLAHLLNQKETGKGHVSPKPFPGYPPGFGYASPQKLTPDAAVAPVKPPTSPMRPADPAAMMQHPPGLTASQSGTPVEFFHLWARPGFAGPISGAPEIPPFPQQSVSPRVSEPASPTQSRATSPHRTFTFRSTRGPLAPNHMLEVLPTHTAPILAPIEPLTLCGLPPFCSDVKGAHDGNHQAEEKLAEQQPWTNSVMVPVEMKPPNGYRFPSYNKVPQQHQQQQYFVNQMQALNVDGENSLHRSNSSSSTSSINQSPPETPMATPTVPYHGPGRGEGKMRVNGVPPATAAYINPNMSPGPPQPPPPPLQCDPNCSVPYSSYPATHGTLAALPNRSMFQYAHAYRPPPFPYQPTDNVLYSYSCPYMPSFVFSSGPSQPAHNRNLNCYNCGAAGHAGADCTAQSIEDITQKGYGLEYNAPLPDADK